MLNNNQKDVSKSKGTLSGLSTTALHDSISNTDQSELERMGKELITNMGFIPSKMTIGQLLNCMLKPESELEESTINVLLKCSMCAVEKHLTHFSNAQRGKKDSRKCSECLGES